MAVYVDGLAIIAQSQRRFATHSQTNLGTSSTVLGPRTHHFGCAFGRESVGTLYYEPMGHVKMMIGASEKMFGDNLH